MKAANTFEEFEKLNGIRLDDVLSVFEAVSDAFPLIVSANLTKNTYTMMDFILHMVLIIPYIRQEIN